jgi:LysM repeat protein
MREARPADVRSLLLSALLLSSSAFQAQAYYHPEEGRWISRDPIGEENSTLYAFVSNDAVAAYDVLGLYYVMQGQTLSAIAAKFGVSYEDIAKANGIPAPYNIQPGQWLKMPTKSGVNYLAEPTTEEGAIQRLLIAETAGPGMFSKLNLNLDEAKKAMQGLHWCICNRIATKGLNTMQNAVKEVDSGYEQWAGFKDYPTLSVGVRSTINDLLVFGYNPPVGKNQPPYTAYLNAVVAESKTACASVQHPWTGNKDVEAKIGGGSGCCAVCYMRTKGSGASKPGLTELGTLANNTFYLDHTVCPHTKAAAP